MTKYLVPGIIILAVFGFIGFILFWFWNEEYADKIKSCLGAAR